MFACVVCERIIKCRSYFLSLSLFFFFYFHVQFRLGYKFCLQQINETINKTLSDVLNLSLSLSLSLSLNKRKRKYRKLNLILPINNLRYSHIILLIIVFKNLTSSLHRQQISSKSFFFSRNFYAEWKERGEKKFSLFHAQIREGNLG